MVDTTTFKVMHEADEAPVQDDLGEELMESDEAPAEPFLLLLPSNIRGYGFHNKKWSKHF